MKSPVLWLAGVKLAFHLFIIQGYGWFRDEFYYIACAEHLDWGYVDHPPLVALVTAATRALFGDSLLAIRLPAALAGAATVVIAGVLARELGLGASARVSRRWPCSWPPSTCRFSTSCR